MTFNLEEIEQQVSEHEELIRVLIVSTNGSTPRESGTRMLVWHEGQKGTIGGGALEYKIQAICRSRLVDGNHDPQVISQPLGPGLGQCCGGHVKFVLEYFNKGMVGEIKTKLIDLEIYERPVQKAKESIRKDNHPSPLELPVIHKGWLTEKLVITKEHLWVFGAGHVGTAIVNLVSNLPTFEITWIDFHEDRFPPRIPDGVKKLIASNPDQLTKYAPQGGFFLVLTHSHDLDLKIMEGLLRRDFRYLGLIGSKTKWVRFQKRLRSLGIQQEVMLRVKCPIGNKDLGKHPWQIAIGVSEELLVNKALHPF